MAISPFQEPGIAPSPAASPEAAPGVQLSEFTLAHHPQPRQLALAHENPLCRLFASTRDGARVCNRGCGITGAAGQVHVCPFGMAMRRLDDPIPAGQSRWIGRRFPTIEALHQGLDRLIDGGMEEEEILARLPVNPIVSDMELLEEIATRQGAQIIAVAPPPTKSEMRSAKSEKKLQTDTAAAPKTAPATPDATPVSNVLEFIDQVHALLAAEDQPGRVCERFLKAVVGLLPFKETAILLRRRMKSNSRGPARLGDELVLTAVESQKQRAEARRSRKTSGSMRTTLSSHELGPIVLAEGRPMMETHGHVEALRAQWPDAGLVAVPIKGSGETGKVLGVWIGAIADDAPAPLADPLRLMGIFGDMLAQRLQAALGPTSRHEHSAAAPLWDETAALAAVAPEIARATRLESPVAMVDARIQASKRGVTLNVERLSIKLRASLRPYDLFAVGDIAGLVWHFLLPHVSEESLHKLAARIQAIFEDELDATGGLEERGVKLALGVSMFGADAADAPQLIAHAAEAAAQAQAIAEPAAVQFHFGFDAQTDVL